MMAKIRTTIVLVGLVALCAVSIASPVGKVADSSSDKLDKINKMMKKIMELGKKNHGSDSAFLNLVESLKGSSSLRNSLDTRNSLEKTREMMNKLAEMCLHNSGSHAAFFNLINTAQSTLVCATSAIDLENYMLDLENFSNETRTTFLPRYCPQLRAASPCIDRFVTGFRPCLEADDSVIMSAFAGFFPDTIELMCTNNGEIIFKLDEPKYSECLYKMFDSFDECLTFLDGTDNDDWDISRMSRDQCGQLTGVRECMKSKMDICKTPDLISVYDLFHNTLFRMTPCRNFVEVE